ncbi:MULTISPECIES: CDP-glycerol glycerophosphotransferase family protein [Halococcus]|uniref:Glycosyl/glycerophosphate transferase n=1 Tax=Halococcus salifodinae DSM 8989 TaxID=1227456 RepID=M0NFP1_9EURY|nr:MULTISPECIES: CDP-glycerol glycerophosphotransferase family protein [Halococcus]EMA55914.1 glycosyl/glycerophosphate transferase [Halococcus salifodinae DSM 8989]
MHSERQRDDGPSDARLAGVRRLVTACFGGLLKGLLYALGLVSPRDERLWVFGCNGGTRFAENSKYLFLHAANEHADEVRPVWLSRRWDIVGELRERGYEAHHADTLYGKYVTLRAGTVFFTHSLNDVVMSCAIGARAVNLWHGVPLKRVSLDDSYYLQRMGWANRLKTRLLYRSYDDVVTTAASLVPKFASAFATSEASVVSLGYPRNDALFGTVSGADIGSDPTMLSRLRELRADNDVVAYVPTWRETGGNPIADADIDLAALDAFLAEEGAVLLCKFHPSTEIAFDDGAYDRIVAVPAGLDVHAMLQHVDCLLTDYSSLYFDFLLLDRPLVFFPYDLERYVARDRELYFEYETVTPGPVATDGAELHTAITTALGDDDPYAAERKRVRDRFFDDPDGNAAERVYSFVRSAGE